MMRRTREPMIGTRVVRGVVTAVAGVMLAVGIGSNVWANVCDCTGGSCYETGEITCPGYANWDGCTGKSEEECENNTAREVYEIGCCGSVASGGLICTVIPDIELCTVSWQCGIVYDEEENPICVPDLMWPNRVYTDLKFASGDTCPI